MKQKMGLRLFSFALSIVVVFSSLQLDAFAREYTGDVPQIDISEEEISELESSLAETLELEAMATEALETKVQEADTESMSPDEYAAWKEAYLLSKQKNELMLVDGNSTSAVSGGYIRNDIIEAYVDSNSQFTIGTVNGSSLPTDNGKKLLYGHPNPWSSFTTVKVDGSNFEFLGTTNRVETKDAISVSYMINNVVTTQSLSIVENEYTGKPDTIAVSYTMTNYDSSSHEVGLRIMLDTMLGSNDGSPFRVPGYGNVTKELELVGGNIPQNWMTFDSLDNPNVIANGCLYRTLDEKPDKVQFAAWGGVNGTLWDYTTSSTKAVTGDSAVAIYYNPKTLAAGESRTVTTYYGIGDFAVSDAKPPLSTRVAAPAELVVDDEEGGYAHNPFSVTAYVQNNGNASATNAKAVLKLPADGSLQLISPLNLEQRLGDIEQGQEVEATWLVYANEQSAKKTAKYSITVSAENESPKTVTVSTILPKTKKIIDNYTVKLNKNKVNLDVDGNYYAQLKATCSDGKDRKVTWLSTNPSVAKVDSNGYVKAINGGKANIVASVGSKNAICEVVVAGTSNPLQKLELSETSAQLKIGQTKQLVARYTPTSVSQKGVKWTSSNPAVAKVNENGRVEAISNGTAQIKATYNLDSSKYAICTVQVGTDEQNINLNQSVSFNETLYGPEISLLGKTFNMFKIPMSTEIKINEAISLKYDESDKSLTGTFGLTGDGSLTDGKEYKNDITKIKKAADQLKKKGPKKFYTSYKKQLKNRKTSPVFFQKGEVSSFGYIKYQQVNGNYKFSEGEVYVVVNFPEIFEIKYNIPACPIVYFKFNISGDVHGGLKLEAEELGFGNGHSMRLDGTIGGSLSLSGGVGADILIAGLEGGLTGTLSIDILHLLNFALQKDLEIKISASLYAKAKALFFLEFNDSWEFASKQLYPRVSNDGMLVESLSFSDENFTPMQVNIKEMDIASVNASRVAEQLENNGYAYNEPEMVMLSGGRILAVWTDNVDGRSEFDRTGIYYSVFENGAWSYPELVDDDGTADFGPVVAVDGEKAYIAWQNMDMEFGDDATLADMLPNTGIKMACLEEGEITNISVLTSDGDNYDAAPRIAAADGKVVVTWCNNDSNDWMLYEGTNTVKQYSVSSTSTETMIIEEEESETDIEEETGIEEETETDVEEETETDVEEETETDVEEETETDVEEESETDTEEVETEEVELLDQSAMEVVSEFGTQTLTIENETESETETEAESETETETETESEETIESEVETELEEEDVAEVTIESENNSETSDVVILYSDNKIVTSYDVAYHNGSFITVLSADEDGDFATFNNAKVYVDGVENESISAAISGRQVMLAQNGSDADLFWWDGEYINVMKSLDAEQVEHCYATVAAVSFEAASNGENSAVYWVETDGKTSALKAVLRDTESGSWNGPINVYDFEGVIRDPSLLIDAYGELDILTNLVLLDENNNDVEVALAYIDLDPTADLQIVDTPYFNDANVVSGETLDIYVDVKNSGMKTVNSVMLSVLDNSGNVITEETIDESFTPGMTKTLSVPYKLPENMTYHNVMVQIQAINVTDCNMQNNEASVYIGDAAVRVSDITVSGYGETRRVYVEVSNSGYLAAEDLTLFITQNATDGTVIGSTQIEKIEGRTKRNISFNLDMSDIDFGEEAGALIYAQLAAGEENLGNEVMMSSVILNPAAEDTITIGAGSYDNKKMMLNFYNNINSQVTGDLYIELLDNDNTIFRVGQEVTISPYGTLTGQYDLSSLLIYPHDRICAYIMDDEGLILSNKIYHNSQSATVGDFDVVLDKQQLILQKGETTDLKASLDIEDWGLADLAWSSSDENIVTVDANGNVTAVSEGVAYITIGSSILEINAECKIIVVDETPLDDYMDTILRTTDVTVDLAKSDGAVVSFTSIYKQNASEIMSNAMEGATGEEETDDKFLSSVTECLVLENESVSELFELQLVDDATALLVPTEKALGTEEYLDKTYVSEVSLKLKGESEKIEIGELTIRTMSSLPKLKGTVGKLDCFYDNTNANVTFAKNGKEVDDIVSVYVDSEVDSKNNTHPEYFVYDNEINALVLADAYEGTIVKGTYPVRLLVNIRGYAVPAKVTVKVKVNETIPNVKLESSEIRLRAIPSNDYAYLSLKVPAALTNMEIQNVSMDGDNSNIFDITTDDLGKHILIKNNSIISDKNNYRIMIRYAGTTRDVVIPVTVKAITDETTCRISKKTVKINRLSQDEAFAQVKISGAADNDIVYIDRYTEVVSKKEVSLTNVSVSYDSTTGMLTVYPRTRTGNFKLKIYPEGSNKALNLTVKVYNKYPVYKVSSSKIGLNTQTRDTKTIYISNNAGSSNEFSYSIRNSRNYPVSIASVTVGDGFISLTPYSSAAKGTYKLLITPYNSGGKTLKVTLKVTTNAPKFSISKSVIKLNKAVPYESEQAVLTIKSKPNGYETENFNFYQIDKYGRKNAVTDFNIIKGADGRIYISRRSDSIKSGTYKLRAISQSYSKAKAINFKVVVENKNITFTQKGNTILNSCIINQAEKSKINLTTSTYLEDIGEFTFYEKNNGVLSECKNVIISKESDGYYATLSESSEVKNGTITLVAKSQTYENAKDVNINVKVVDKTPSMNASFTGKIDSVDPSSYVDVKLNMVNNKVVMSDTGKISVDNVNFSLYSFRPEEATVRIRLTSMADLSVANANKVVITYEDNAGNKIATGKVTVPIKTSKVSLNTDKSLYELYRADKTDEALIKLVSNNSVNAVVDSVEFANISDESRFEIRCVSKATRKYAIGIVDENLVSAGNYKVKLKIKVHGVAKPIEKEITISVK